MVLKDVILSAVLLMEDGPAGVRTVLAVRHVVVVLKKRLENATDQNLE